MPTTLYADLTSLYTPAFEFDADLNWGETFSYEATKRKIEGIGEAADYIAAKGKTATLSGRVTATQLDPLNFKPQKLSGGRDALEQLCDKRGLVLVVNDMYCGMLAIVEGEVTKGVEDGYSFRASLKFERLVFTNAATTAIPAAALKKAMTAKKAGAQAKRAANAGEKAKSGSVLVKTLPKLGVALPSR